jgi:glycosyl-4,4'-diaponeurosporenoate acyltransferase
VRIVSRSERATVVIDIVAWAVVHSATGYAVHRIPTSALDRSSWWSTPRSFERGGEWYRRRLRIGRWKDRLPEAGALFAGGVSKRRIPEASAGGLERFVIETRRAELGHWLAVAMAPLFALWNPRRAVALMVIYGLAANLPFIAIQRYNRFRAERIVCRRREVGVRNAATDRVPRSRFDPSSAAPR